MKKNPVETNTNDDSLVVDPRNYYPKPFGQIYEFDSDDSYGNLQSSVLSWTSDLNSNSEKMNKSNFHPKNSSVRKEMEERRILI